LDQFHFERAELFALIYGGILLIVLGFAATWYIPRVFRSTANPARPPALRTSPSAHVEPPSR